MTAPEFSRPERADTIGDEPRTVAIEASDVERAALAARFDLIAIDRLTGDVTVRRDAAGIVVEGRIVATVTQACSVTSDPLPVSVDEPILLRFVEAAGGQDEVELDDADIDVIAIEGGAIDLGEVAAETVMLALDPFSRAPGAEAMLKAAGVIGEDEAKPLGAFAGLKDKLAGS